MKRYLLAIVSILVSIPPVTYACSVFSSHITNDKGNIVQVMVGRTLDFELGSEHNSPVMGAKGTQNTSHVNVGGVPEKQAATWKNQYKYIGMPMGAPIYNNRLNDGVNTQGLYAAQLYLPQATTYPEPKLGSNQPKVLGVLDVVNYVLGTSKNVKEAINNLQKIQVVASGLYDPRNQHYHVQPVHFFLKDKTGHGAVIEFVDGKMKVYSGKHAGHRINALTNSPAYDWQISHYDRQKSQFKPHNTNYQVDDVYANGSGYKGLPGDFMPQSRFVKIKAMLTALPAPHTQAQLNYNIQMILNSVTVPPGMNPAPTIWKSRANLTEGTYTIIPVLKLALQNKFIPAQNRNEYQYNIHEPMLASQVKVQYPEHTSDDSSKVIKAEGPQPGTPYQASYVNTDIHALGKPYNPVSQQRPLP